MAVGLSPRLGIERNKRQCVSQQRREIAKFLVEYHFLMGAANHTVYGCNYCGQIIVRFRCLVSAVHQVVLFVCTYPNPS